MTPFPVTPFPVSAIKWVIIDEPWYYIRPPKQA